MHLGLHPWQIYCACCYIKPSIVQKLTNPRLTGTSHRQMHVSHCPRRCEAAAQMCSEAWWPLPTVSCMGAYWSSVRREHGYTIGRGTLLLTEEPIQLTSLRCGLRVLPTTYITILTFDCLMHAWKSTEMTLFANVTGNNTGNVLSWNCKCSL